MTITKMLRYSTNFQTTTCKKNTSEKIENHYSLEKYNCIVHIYSIR